MSKTNEELRQIAEYLIDGLIHWLEHTAGIQEPRVVLILTGVNEKVVHGVANTRPAETLEILRQKTESIRRQLAVVEAAKQRNLPFLPPPASDAPN